MSGMPAQTGPKTLQGKAHSSMNAMKHGYSSKSLLIDGELPHEWRQHLDDIKQSYPITTPAQKNIVEAIATASWQIKRLERLVEGDVRTVSQEPISRLSMDMSFGKSNIDSNGPTMPLMSYSYEVVVDTGMEVYLMHEKILRAIGFWQDYLAGEDIYASELVDLMPQDVREIFDELANKKSLQIDDYLESDLDQQDLELIHVQLRALRRVSADYLNNHPSDESKIRHWESAKALRVYEAYNQPSYQRSIASARKTLNSCIGLYQQLSTMHIDQIPSTKMAKRTLKDDAITDVDATH